MQRKILCRTNQPNKRAKFDKGKLLSLLLKRYASKLLKESFMLILQSADRFRQKLKKLQIIWSIHGHARLMLAWEKLKNNAYIQKNEAKIINKILIIYRRQANANVKYSFNLLRKSTRLQPNSTFYRTNVIKILRVILKNKKKQHWQQIINYANYKKQEKRLTVLNLIVKGVRSRQILQAWSKLLQKMRRESINSEAEINNLQIHVDDLNAQVENKNAKIVGLQNEIAELKQSTTTKNGDSSSFIYYPINSHNRSGSFFLQKSRARFNKSFDRDSHDSSMNKDSSFGSLLGSFQSYKSKDSQNSQSPKSNRSSPKKQPCTCADKDNKKYEKYRAANETLKKQMELIKAELEFTKDMNEHMEDEIRMHLGNDDKNQKIQELRNELREVRKERQAFREKSMKYEKYANKLKAEFKVKVEQIYRRVKKNNI